MHHTSLERAYAIFGLEPGASPRAIKRRYKALVRRWHPDRFAGDPQAVDECTLRLRVINEAHDEILASIGGTHVSSVTAPAPITSSLTPQQIDEIVGAIRDARRFQLQGERWQRLLALFLVVTSLGLFFWTRSSGEAPLMPVRHATAPARAVLFNAIVVLAIWYGDARERAVAWFALVLLEVLLPIAALLVLRAA